MDNLELMKQMPNDYIDLIYNDVLFNTSKKFKDFNDNLGTPQQAIEWYKPRIIEMKRVLKDTGNIYIHCDWHLSAYLRVLMDEIFGINNFRNEIIWFYNSAPRKKKCFGNRHDTILRYSKTDKFYFDDTKVREPYSLSAPRGYEKEKYYNPLGKVMGDVWQIKILGQNDKTERVGYDTQKPKELIKRIVESSSKSGDIVCDLFMGSGTSIVVAKELGRNYIGCDISERAIEITRKRLNR